jgi:hypothetical protein
MAFPLIGADRSGRERRTRPVAHRASEVACRVIAFDFADFGDI